MITEINAASGVLRRQLHEVMENSAPDPKTSNERAHKLAIQNQVPQCRQIVPDLTIYETVLVSAFARQDGKQVIPDLTAYLFGNPDLPGTAAVRCCCYPAGRSSSWQSPASWRTADAAIRYIAQSRNRNNAPERPVARYSIPAP